MWTNLLQQKDRQRSSHTLAGSISIGWSRARRPLQRDDLPHHRHQRHVRGRPHRLRHSQSECLGLSPLLLGLIEGAIYCLSNRHEQDCPKWQIYQKKLSQVEIKSKLGVLLKSSILILRQKPSKYKIVLVCQGWVLKGKSSNWDDLIYIELSFFKIKFLTSPRSL